MSRTADSPCRNICQLDDTGALCIGCGRTLAEITDWAGYTLGQRAAVRAAARLAGRQSPAPGTPCDAAET